MNKGDLIPVFNAEILKSSAEKKEIYVFSSELEAGFKIDGLAAVLCTKMLGQKKLSDLVKDLCAEWDLPELQMVHDVEFLLTELESNKMLIWLTEPTVF